MHLTSNVDKNINNKYILTKYAAFNLLDSFKCVPVTSLDFCNEKNCMHVYKNHLFYYNPLVIKSRERLQLFHLINRKRFL